jgi:hypothetical protein
MSSTHMFREVLAQELQTEPKARTVMPPPSSVMAGGVVLVAALAVWRAVGRRSRVDEAEEEDPLFQRF